MRHFMDLRLFDNEDNGSGSSQGNNGGSSQASYTYEQLEEIATSRATRAEQAALSNYLKSQGLTQDEVSQAIKSFKEQRDANKPDITKITAERDAALAEIQNIKNKASLKGLDVQSEFEEFVMSEISKNVTKDKNFEDAAKEYKKAHPQYFVKKSGFKVSSTPGTGSSESGTSSKSINDMIRKQFGY